MVHAPCTGGHTVDWWTGPFNLHFRFVLVWHGCQCDIDNNIVVAPSNELSFSFCFAASIRVCMAAATTKGNETCDQCKTKPFYDAEEEFAPVVIVVVEDNERYYNSYAVPKLKVLTVYRMAKRAVSNALHT